MDARKKASLRKSNVFCVEETVSPKTKQKRAPTKISAAQDRKKQVSSDQPRRKDAPVYRPPALRPEDGLQERLSGVDYGALRDLHGSLVRRRRRSQFFLYLRWIGLVFLPSLSAAWYFFFVETPLYTAHSVIEVGSGELGYSVQPQPFQQIGTSSHIQDSISVQEYLISVEAVRSLEESYGFRRHFVATVFHPWRRLDQNSSLRHAHETFKRMVRVSFDPSDGIIRLTTRAPSPSVAEELSNELIMLAEQRLHQKSATAIGELLSNSARAIEVAEANLDESQKRVLNLQLAMGVLDASSETELRMKQILSLEEQRVERRMQLERLLRNDVPNSARINSVTLEIKMIDDMIAENRQQMASRDPSSESIAQISGQLKLAEAELETRFELLRESVRSHEIASNEAGRQSKHLTISVNPVAYRSPDKWIPAQKSGVFFLVLTGIYLMFGITFSTIKEQRT